MRPFRFRAEGALDLRRRHEDAARLVVSRAQNAAALADAKLREAQSCLDDASASLVRVQSQGTSIWMIDWHRSWILRQAREVNVCRTQVEAASQELARATVALHEAHRKRRVLERLRDRLQARHARAAERQELAQMNELATMRYLIARGERKEQQ